MQHQSIINLNSIKNEVELRGNKTEIIAVSKTFQLDKIKPLIDYGHIHFGENKVQEAVEKWTEQKKINKNIKLHLIGKLQTNKVKYCLPLFDYIHSLDSLKLAEKISTFQIKEKFKPKIFIQINFGNEVQKNGIQINELDFFINECQKNFDLDIIGLMCIPPNTGNPKSYFEKMNKLKEEYNFNNLSMGMSSDYLDAISYGADFVRIGSKIFGERS